MQNRFGCDEGCEFGGFATAVAALWSAQISL